MDYSKPREKRLRQIAGTAIGWQDGGYAAEGSLPSGPLWLGLSADVAIFAAAWMALLEAAAFGLRARQRRRARRGICVCGYDRRGQPRGARCPECGTAPKAG
jgi:hypothetical protein